MATFTYQTVAAMQQPPVGALPSPGDTAIVAGYHVYDDDGGGTFRLELPDGAYEHRIDGGMVFDCVRSDTSTRIGVWRRIDQGPVRTAWYGIGNVRAIGTEIAPVTATAERIEKAIAAAGVGEAVIVSGSITLDRTVHMSKTVQLKGEGEGWDRPVIKAGENLKVMFTREASTRFWVTGISFEGWVDPTAQTIGDVARGTAGIGTRTIGFVLFNDDTEADLDCEFAFCRFYRMKVGILAMGRSVLTTRTHFSSCCYGIVVAPSDTAGGETDSSVRALTFHANRFHSCGSHYDLPDLSLVVEIEADGTGAAFDGLSEGDFVVFHKGSSTSDLREGCVLVVGPSNTLYDRPWPGLFVAGAPDAAAWGALQINVDAKLVGASLDRTSTCIMTVGLANRLKGGLISDVYVDDCRRFYHGAMGEMRIAGVTGYRGYGTMIETPAEGLFETKPGISGAVQGCQWTCNLDVTRSGAAMVIRSSGLVIADNLIVDPAGSGITIAGQRCVVRGNVVRRPRSGGWGIDVNGVKCVVTGNVVDQPGSAGGVQVLGAANVSTGNEVLV